MLRYLRVTVLANCRPTTLPPPSQRDRRESAAGSRPFFNWIKQYLRIKRFLGTRENDVKAQIWCAVATHALIAIVKKEVHLDASLYICPQILSERTLLTWPYI